MTQIELAQTTGISQSFVSMLEDNLRKPSDIQLLALATSLDLPEKFFYREDLILGAGIGEVFHRKRKSIPAKELEAIHAWRNFSTFTLRRLIAAIELPETVLPVWDEELDDRSIEHAADVFRAKLYVPLGPILSVSTILNRAGVLIVPLPVHSSKIDAIGQWVTGLPPMIFVNPEVPQDRLRFTLLHEIGHLVLHQNAYSLDLSDEVERQANLFAAAVLMPKSEIAPELRDLDVPRLAGLKRKWRVAMSALLMRAKQLEKITPVEEQRLWREFSRNGWRTREPMSLNVTGEEPFRRFDELVFLYTRQLGYSLRDIAQLVNFHPADASLILRSQGSGPRLVQ